MLSFGKRSAGHDDAPEETTTFVLEMVHTSDIIQKSRKGGGTIENAGCGKSEDVFVTWRGPT